MVHWLRPRPRPAGCGLGLGLGLGVCGLVNIPGITVCPVASELIAPTQKKFRKTKNGVDVSRDRSVIAVPIFRSNALFLLSMVKP